MRFRVLGPIAALDGDEEVSLGGPRQRAVLALLLATPGRTVSTDRFIDEIWREDSVDTERARASLYTLVSNLRHVLGSDRIRHGPAGYTIALRPGDEVDAAVFESAVEAAHRASDGPAELAARLGKALQWWAGTPYTGTEDVAAITLESIRLEELRACAELDRIEAELIAGGAPPVEEAIAARDRRPLDERAWSLLVRSLYRADRQSEAIRELHALRDTLRDELGLDPSPRLTRLEEQVLTHDPALDATFGRDPRVPRYLSSFVGRSTDLQTILDALTTHRLVTLSGPGGAGKSRLAVELASRSAHRYPDGIWLVDLARLTRVDSLATELATTVGAPGADRAPMRGLQVALDGRRALLVIDNAEHLVAQVSTLVDEILPRADRLTILITSRVALGIPGERVVPIGGLPVGHDDGMGAAEQLFVDRAGDHGVDVDGDLPEVRSVCRQLDGLPLAIELAASRSSAASPAEMAELIAGQRVALHDDAQQRDIHRSLEATIEWSYDLLDDDDRSAFAALGVFEGPFVAAAAATVLASDETQALDTLQRLVTSSVVTSQPTGERTTYRLLQTLRAFARERLHQSSRWAEVAARHDDHYLARATSLADDFLGRRRVDATHDVSIELADQVATWDRLFDADPERLLPLGWALGNVWLFEGRLADGELRLSRLLDATTEVRSMSRGDVLMISSWIFAFRDALPRALALAREGLALYEEFGTPHRLAYGLARVGHWAFATGDAETGMANLQRSVALCEQIGFDDGRAWPLALIAQARRWNGDDSTEVREMLLDARRRFRELGETYGQIHADMLLSGLSAFGPEERLGFAAEMVELSGGPGSDNLMRPIALHNLAYAVADAGDHERALGLNHSAIRSSRATGATIDLGLCLLQAASFSAKYGDLVRATTLLGAGIAHFGMPIAPFQEVGLAPIRIEGPARLGGARYDELLRIGAAMSADDAARTALECPHHDDRPQAVRPSGAGTAAGPECS